MNIKPYTELHGAHLDSKNGLLKCCIENSSYPTGDILEGADYIDYNMESSENSDRVLRKGILDTGIGNMLASRGFQISILSETNKYSDDFRNCLCVVIVGKSKKTGKNISILCHINPNFIKSLVPINGKIKLGDAPKLPKNYFKYYLERALSEIQIECKDGTVDAVILGGNSHYSGVIPQKYGEYKKAVKQVNDIVRGKLGFNAVILGGPSDNDYTNGQEQTVDEFPNAKSVFLDTQNRRIYFFKKFDESKGNNPSFVANDVAAQVRKLI